MASSPQFFKIVMQSSLEDRKLMLPKKFISLYGEALPNSVLLKLPNDSKWKVELTASDDGLVWLHKGWHEFAEHFSLEHGSFLVFRFDGNSSFHTTIFHKTGLEIEYPSNHVHVCKSKSGRKSIQDLVEILDDFSQQYQKMMKPANLPHCQPSKKMRKEESCSPKLQFEGLNIVEKGPEGMADSKRCSKHEAAVRRKPLPAPVEVEAVQSCDALKSENLSFKIVMRQSYVQGRYFVVIPIAFARRHFLEKSGTITLQISDGRSWKLAYNWYCRRKYACISSGWKEFAKANFLKEGDVGVFKLIEKDNILFTIQQNSSPSQAEVKLEDIERNHINAKASMPRQGNPPPAKEGNGGSSSLEISQNSKNGYAPDLKQVTAKAPLSKNLKALGVASEFMSTKPFFEVILRQNDVAHSSSLNVPAGFAREHFLQRTSQIVKLYARHGLWKVKLKKYDYHFKFSAGWRSFFKDNLLEEGDTCIFEMISKKDCVLKVTTFDRMGSLKCKG